MKKLFLLSTPAAFTIFLCLFALMPLCAWSAVNDYTYNFSTISGDKDLTSSSTEGSLSVLTDYPNLAVHDITTANNRWYIHNKQLYLGAGGARELAVLNLHNGDKVTFNFTKNNDNGNINGVTIGTNYDAGTFKSVNAWYYDTDEKGNNVRKQVTTSTVIESGKEYYMSADGTLSIDFHRYIGINSITVKGEEPSISFEKLSEEGYIGELIKLGYDEPTLTFKPASATVTYSSSNVKVAKIGGEAHDGDLMFINTGITTITASMVVGGVTYSDSYTVTVSADDATWEVDGTTYRVTGAGKLQDRVVTQVPHITMEFGTTEVVNTTIVRDEENIGFVATTIDQDGWRTVAVETRDGHVVPVQGSFYAFKPAVGGTLSFKGYPSRNNTTVLVDATNGYAVMKTYDYVSERNAINETGIAVEAGHTYYLYGNVPGSNGGDYWNTFQLYSFGFVPAFHFEDKAVRVAAGVKTYTQAVKGAGAGTTYSVATRGDIASASVDNSGVVTFSYDEDMGGAVVVTAANGELTDYYVITIPYSYNKDKTWVMWGSAVTKDEMEANTDDWGVNYEVRSYNNSTRALTYLNNAVMVANSSVNGSNAYYLDETAGLWFKANAKNFGVRMNKYPDALVGVDKTNPEAVDEALQKMLAYPTTELTEPMMVAYGDYTQLTIPDVPEGKYIIMKWQSHDAGAGEIYSTSGNLEDLNGKSITDEIKIAKVVEVETRARGSFVFRVKEAGDVVFDLKDKGWTEVYEITVADTYTSDMALKNASGNTIGATNSAFVYNGTSPKTVIYKAGPNYADCVRGGTLHYSIETEGSVQASLQTVAGENNSWYDLRLTVTGGVGNVKIIQEVMDNTDKYLVNKLETWIPVGILETLQYPYTWDFTQENMSLSGQKVAESTVDSDKYGSWNEDGAGIQNTFSVPVLDEKKKNLSSNKLLFASGSQLTRGDETIKETQGLGIGWSNELCAANTPNKVTLGSDGMTLSRRGGAAVIVTIPSVSKGSFVYVKSSIEPNLVRELPSKTQYSKLEDSGNGCFGYKITGNGGDVEVRFANGPVIYKIGVTDVTKSLNDIGYATESRNHAIDHRLTGEFTSNDANAHVVTFGSYNRDKATISKTEVSVVPENTGIVLYKKDATEAVTVPLFYPAINITPLADESELFEENMMAPNVEAITDGSFNSETETIDGISYTRFIMTRTYYTYRNGDFSEPKTAQQEGFYRMIGSKSGNMGANKAYLLVPTDQLPVAAWNGGTGGNAKDGYLMFEEDLKELEGTTTGIVEILDESAAVGIGKANTYYTIDGVRLSGKPSTRGLYILNGKKIFIK